MAHICSPAVYWNVPTRCRFIAPVVARSFPRGDAAKLAGESVVVVGNGLLDEVPTRLQAAGLRPSTFVVVSDKNVFGHHGDRLMQAPLSWTRRKEHMF